MLYGGRGGSLPRGRESEMNDFHHVWSFQASSCLYAPSPWVKRETDVGPEAAPAPPERRPHSATSNKKRRAGFTFLSATSAPFATRLPSPTRNVDHYTPSRPKLHSSGNLLRRIPTHRRDGPPRNGLLRSFPSSHVIFRLGLIEKRSKNAWRSPGRSRTTMRSRGIIGVLTLKSLAKNCDASPAELGARRQTPTKGGRGRWPENDWRRTPNSGGNS